MCKQFSVPTTTYVFVRLILRAPLEQPSLILTKLLVTQIRTTTQLVGNRTAMWLLVRYISPLVLARVVFPISYRNCFVDKIVLTIEAKIHSRTDIFSDPRFLRSKHSSNCARSSISASSGVYR